MCAAFFRRCGRLAGLILLLTGLVPLSLFAQEGWKAGAASVCITPEEPLWMAGYASRTEPASGKYTDLWVKSLVLQDAQGRRAVLVTCDLIGINRDLAESICGKLQERYGLNRPQIALCFSHTHSGPVVGRNLRPMHYLQLSDEQQAAIIRYTETLEQHVLECVGKAIDDLEPAEVQWGSGTATFAVNRRNNPEAQVPDLREQNALKGPVDHDVPVLAVRAGDRLKAVAFGYACHATVLCDQSWCGDYPGYAQQQLQERNPDCIALFWAGCGGDQNPLPRRQLELAQQYGRQLADAVSEVLAGQMHPLPASITTTFEEIPLKLDTLPSKADWEKAAESSNRYEKARARSFLEQIEAGQPIPDVYPYGIGVWTLGDEIEWVFLGGEVVVDYALRLKKELKGKQTWVAGYSNDVMAYIPSLRVLREGGYEGGGAMIYYGLPTVWSPEVEETVIGAVGEMAGKKE